MSESASSPTLLLIVVNLALGAVCLVAVVAVVAAIALDLAERWRIRASLPKGWPPGAPPARVVGRKRRPRILEWIRR